MGSNLNKILETGEFSKKSRVKSKPKGGRFERKIAKLFNSKFKCEEFTRTPGSGAFATTHQLPEHLELGGDLITPKGFKFIIECKSGYDIKFHDLFRKGGDLFKFIKQAKRDAKKSKKEWLVIYKKDYQEEIVVTELDILEIQDRIQLNGNYFLYTLKDFIKLDEKFFFNEL